MQQRLYFYRVHFESKGWEELKIFFLLFVLISISKKNKSFLSAIFTKKIKQ